MTQEPIRFEDGAGYERMMGTWSRLVGERFLDWVHPASGLRWVDVGCGNGAFTELLVERCAPLAVTGVDPSPQQLEFARTRAGTPDAQYLTGDAMSLPVPDHAFDAAVMALVIFFVPEPARGVAEMVRAVRPGGLVSAYAWDILNGGFPLAPIGREMVAMGMPTAMPPSVEAAELARLRELWANAGVASLETTQFTVERTFESFEEFWTIGMLSASLANRVQSYPAPVQAELKERVKAKLVAQPDGSIRLSARANAIKGVVPRG